MGAFLLSVVAGAVFLLLFLLSIPDVGAAMTSGTPVQDIITFALSDWVAKLYLVTIAWTLFLAHVHVLSPACTRHIFGMARAGQLPFSGALAQTGRAGTPWVAAVVLGVITSLPLIFVTRTWRCSSPGRRPRSTCRTSSCSAVALIARLRGWPKEPAPFSLGRWGIPVNARGGRRGATLLNLLWPRDSTNPVFKLDIRVAYWLVGIPLVVGHRLLRLLPAPPARGSRSRSRMRKWRSRPDRGDARRRTCIRLACNHPPADRRQAARHRARHAGTGRGGRPRAHPRGDRLGRAPARASGSGPSGTWPSATGSAAPRCASPSTRSSRPAISAASGVAPADVRRRAPGRARPHAHHRAARLPEATGVRGRHAGSVRAADRGGRRDGAEPGAGAGRARLRDRADEAGRRGAGVSSAPASRPSGSPACSITPCATRSTRSWRPPYGVVPREAIERIEIVGASATAARSAGRAALVAAARRSVRVMVDDERRPFELSHDLFRGDRVRVVVRGVADQDTPGVIARSIQTMNPPGAPSTKGST